MEGHTCINSRAVDTEPVGEYLEALGQALQNGDAKVTALSENREVESVGGDLEISFSITFTPREGLVLNSAVQYDDGRPKETWYPNPE